MLLFKDSGEKQTNYEQSLLLLNPEQTLPYPRVTVASADVCAIKAFDEIDRKAENPGASIEVPAHKYQQIDFTQSY